MPLLSPEVNTCKTILRVMIVTIWLDIPLLSLLYMSAGLFYARDWSSLEINTVFSFGQALKQETLPFGGYEINSFCRPFRGRHYFTLFDLFICAQE